MIKGALEYLLKLAPPTFKTVEGREYACQINGMALIQKPAVRPLTVHTLTGLVKFITDQNESDLQEGGYFVHVLNHRHVDLISDLDKNVSSRDHYLSVDAPEFEGFRFGQFMDLEDFIIQLQAKFVQDQNSEAILKLVSNIKDENVTTNQDDGFSQMVTVRQGPAMVESVRVPNPVTLRPFRTFQEVEQPASPFVFRLRGGGGEPSAALFEADGGQWKLTAIQTVADYLISELGDTISVVA